MCLRVLSRLWGTRGGHQTSTLQPSSASSCPGSQVPSLQEWRKGSSTRLLSRGGRLGASTHSPWTDSRTATRLSPLEESSALHSHLVSKPSAAAAAVSP